VLTTEQTEALEGEGGQRDVWRVNQIRNLDQVVGVAAGRKYINYEIGQSIARGNAIIGVQIRHLKDSNGNTDTVGSTPTNLTAEKAKIYKYVDHYFAQEMDRRRGHRCWQVDAPPWASRKAWSPVRLSTWQIIAVSLS